jgi:hypothetical protein
VHDLHLVQHQVLLVLNVQTHILYLPRRKLIEHLVVKVGKMLAQLEQPVPLLLGPQVTHTPMAVPATD